jgi:hypothetical protein
MKKQILFLFFLITLAFSEQIFNLPGLATQPTFKQYSGYITVDKGFFFFKKRKVV